jgi:8-oxo-dGTP diphosphatase
MIDVDPRLTDIHDCLYRLAVKAIIVNQGKVLLVKELDDDFWSFPGGGIDYGESDLQALVRELHEEIGVEPKDIKTDGRVSFVTVGQVSSGIPKANLFYMVNVPFNKITIGRDVEKLDWYSPNQLKQIHFSESTGDLTQIIASLQTH